MVIISVTACSKNAQTKKRVNGQNEKLVHLARQHSLPFLSVATTALFNPRTHLGTLFFLFFFCMCVCVCLALISELIMAIIIVLLV